MGKIRVIIADDHPVFREGLARLLKDETDLEVIALVEDGDEAVESAKKLRPDVAILDVYLPQLSGIDAAEEIRKISPSTVVLMVSAYNYQSYVLGALRVGAMGYLPKKTPLNKLVNAIRMVHGGQAVFDMKIMSKILVQSKPGEIERMPQYGGMQPREIQVLKLVAQGGSNKQIANQLGIKERTVQTHLINIFNKLQINSRTGAVIYALKEGWLSPEDLINQGNH